jgi:tetratricopeptide (TPR) repeat protein
MSIPDTKTNPRATGICLILALATLLLYWPVTHHSFITLDDNQYVTANPQVQAGLTWAGVKWAFQNTIASNWHPLTWLSHMLDCQLFGLNPAGHHLTNVFFHIANTLLLFVWLDGTTGARWRSALVAALFAWHPLHVESVAWVAERKDVLSAFFWLLTLLAYSKYVTSDQRRVTSPVPARPPSTRRSSLYYFLSLVFFALGLMSKPMVVTLPFVLLLVDFWPLNRLTPANFSGKLAGRLMLEKLPFLALAAAASCVNVIAQKAGGATWSLAALPMHTRVANALVSYSRYLSKTFWPADLAIIYPYQNHWPLAAVLAAAALLLLWSGVVGLRAQRKPFLFFGWFYFVGTLVPTIGLVQAGPQAMADRYMYLPSIGLFVLIVWGVHELLADRPQRKIIATVAGAVALGGCAFGTSLQLAYWQDSVKLFLHTVKVTPDNYTADDYLGGALEQAGLKDEAVPFYAESVRLAPHFPIAQWNLGIALLRQGRAAEAGEHLAVAAQLTPNDPVIRCYFGQALAAAGNPAAAAAQFAAALQLKPDYANAQLLFAVNLARQNQIAAALPHFSAAARLEPDNPEVCFNYGLALLDDHQAAEAAVQFTRELELTPDETKAHFRLALAMQQQGNLVGAAAHFRQALKLTPELPEARAALDAIVSAHPELK